MTYVCLPSGPPHGLGDLGPVRGRDGLGRRAVPEEPPPKPAAAAAPPELRLLLLVADVAVAARVHNVERLRREHERRWLSFPEKLATAGQVNPEGNAFIHFESRPPSFFGQILGGGRTSASCLHVQISNPHFMNSKQGVVLTL